MSSKLNIVGPQPEKTRYQSNYNSIRFEALLLMAKYDKKFKNALISNREKAVEQSGIRLDEKERILLFLIDTKTLLSSIKAFSIPGVKKRTLPSWKKAAAVIFLISFIQQGHPIENINNFAPKNELRTINSNQPGFEVKRDSINATWITGIITDKLTGDPLPGVNILIRGTSNGTICDLEGFYKIKADSGDVLEFSYIGYFSQLIAYNGQKKINVSLQEDCRYLDDIIVVGYGHRPTPVKDFFERLGRKNR
ncbi:MAG: carboxypeptidase-like regulatory domain-containing protein [Bacteroidales bacterium]|nr:carboxypeptidase-like regulatory domain-containing protein [Bacteroidales bacterium]